jgi:hypothetical protein
MGVSDLSVSGATLSPLATCDQQSSALPPRAPKEGTINQGARTISACPSSRTVLPVDADNLRVEPIAAHLEEAEQ